MISSAAALPLSAPAGAPTGGFAGWTVDVMDHLGAAGAGLAIALENLFPPLPSEAVLPLAGFAASTGDLSLVAVLVGTTLGSVVGALVLYASGRWLGRDRMRRLAGRVPLVKVADVHRAEAWFVRHGSAAVFLGRMVPLIRSLVSIPAGVERMPLPRFLVLTTAGSAAWNTVFVLAGYGLGRRWERVEPYAGAVEKAVLVVIVLAAATFCLRRLASARGRAGRHCD